jgi:GTP-binding protein HflX
MVYSLFLKFPNVSASISHWKNAVNPVKNTANICINYKIGELLQQFFQQSKITVRMQDRELAILISDKVHNDYDPLEELKQLTKTAGAEVTDSIRFDFLSPTPNFFIGKGQAEKLSDLCKQKNADLVIFDHELSPVQQRNLEEITQTKVIDRPQLILDIFAQHASSKEGEIQVELAQLNYLLPRLSGRGRELSRLGGGIGTRGPGEMKLEYDRRRIRRRITLLNGKLKKIALHRELQRKKRRESITPLAVLVGYTNSGKTTLINRLADASFPQGNQLFLTLDSRMRRIEIDNNQEVILVDTVGFIKGLPHQLTASFKSTLEEVNYADILIHVINSTSVDVEGDYKVVVNVLEELHALDKPLVAVLNKEDMLTIERKREIKRIFPDGIFISALNGNNMELLKNKLFQILQSRREVVKFSIPLKRMDIISMIHDQGKIILEQFESNGVKITAEVPPALSGKLNQYKVV